MSSPLPFKSYKELAEVMKITGEATMELFASIRSVFTEQGQSLLELCQQMALLTAEYLPKTDKRAVPCKFQPSCPLDSDSYISELGKVFPKLASETLLQHLSFASIGECMQNACCAHLDRDSREYEAKSLEILNSLNQHVAAHEDALAKYDSIHKEYLKASVAVKEEKRNAREKFIKAKNAAVQAHGQLREKLAHLSLQMETVVTEFEELEQWKIDRIAGFVDFVGDQCADIHEKFIEGKGLIFSAVHRVEIEKDIRKVKKFRKIKHAQADDDMQILKVNTSIGKLLPAEDLFPEEVAAGWKVFRVTKDFEGRRDFLTVKAGDLVVSEDTSESSEIICKNVNESVGKLPKCVLEAE